MVEKKVQASTAVSAVTGLVLWILGKYVFKSQVPDVIVSWVYFFVPGILTFLAGYFTKHTSRPDLQVVAAPQTSSVKVVPSEPPA